jgi:hypothetical protein
MPPVAPPRDSAGIVVPHNHEDILDSHHVIRHTTPNDLVTDVDTGERRISSGAYSESSDGGMSVDIEDWMIRDGIVALHYVIEPSHGATRINVGALRALGFQVGWDPKISNPHHGAVWGLTNSKRRTKVAKLAKLLRKAEGEA